MSWETIMSLAGNLEDLGLGDIVHIVNLNQKSGVLFLRSNEHEGLVVFRQGQVVRARSTCKERFIGEILVEKGLVDARKVQDALTIQQLEGFRDRLGSILVRNFSVQPQVVEDVARNQIKEIMRDLFSWRRGPFSFEVEEDADALEDVFVNPVQFMLDHGIHPQLARKGGMQPVTLKVGTPSGRAAKLSASVRESLERRAVLVDDDPGILEYLASFLGESHWTIHSFGRCGDALIAIDGMYRTGERPSVVIDLIMPRMDGTGILGGVELLELLHRDFFDLPLLAIADYHNLEAERRVKSMGYSFLRKPRRSESSDAGTMRFFSSRLLQELERRTSSEEAHHELEPPATENPEEQDARPVDTPFSNREIAKLRNKLSELNACVSPEGITRLILQFAGEFMTRTVMFSVTDQELVAIDLFGFGDLPADQGNGHRICVPRDESSLFTTVLQSRSAAKVKPHHTAAEADLFRILGGVPSEVFLGPIVSGGKVVAIVYGDTIPEGKAFAHTDILEIFLSQAGMAMEKALHEQVPTEIPAEAL